MFEKLGKKMVIIGASALVVVVVIVGVVVGINSKKDGKETGKDSVKIETDKKGGSESEKNDGTGLEVIEEDDGTQGDSVDVSDLWGDEDSNSEGGSSSSTGGGTGSDSGSGSGNDSGSGSGSDSGDTVPDGDTGWGPLF